MKTHELKQESDYFDQQKDKIKKFEIRKNDRDYQVGDILELKRYHKDWGYLKTIETVSMEDFSTGTGLKQCAAWQADTLKVKIVEIMSWDYLSEPDDEKSMFSSKEIIAQITQVLDDYFQADCLPQGYVLLGTEVIE